MVARCLQLAVNAAKHARTGVGDFRYLAVKGSSAYHLGAEGLTDRLMTEAHAEDGSSRRGLRNQLEANAGFVWRAGARRQHDGVRLKRHDICDRNLVVAVHDDIRPQPAKIVEEVEGEAIVIVDQDDHVSPLYQGFTVP